MSKPVHLLQLSDPHIGAEWADADAVAGLLAAVTSVRQLADRMTAILITGDLADHGADDEYETVRELVSELNAPLYPLAGNHDDRDALRRHFELPGNAATPVQYAVDVGATRLVVLDSTCPGADHGELDAARLAWLDETLAAAPDQLTVLAMHHPPAVTGVPAWDRIGLAAGARTALADVLRGHPQVRRILAGHIHRAFVGDIADRVVLAAPSTYVQARLDLSATTLQFDVGVPSYAVHTLVEDGISSDLHVAAAT